MVGDRGEGGGVVGWDLLHIDDTFGTLVSNRAVEKKQPIKNNSGLRSIKCNRFVQSQAPPESQRK